MMQHWVAISPDQLHLLVVELLVVHIEAHAVVVLDADGLLRLALIRTHTLAHADVAGRHARESLVGAEALSAHVTRLIHLNRVDLDEVASVDHIHSDHRRSV